MNKQELATRIWQSANKMRSKIDANDYKDYILGLIFYKFLSDNLERFVLNQGATQEDLREVLNPEDLETLRHLQDNVGYFIEHKDLYSTWLAEGSDFNIGQARIALAAFSSNIAPTNEGLFGGIFDTLQSGLSNLGDTAMAQTKAIKELLNLIKDIPMDTQQDYDVLGFIYEYLISNFAANAGKKAGEFYTPHEVSDLMSRIVASHLKGRRQIEIYDPTSGSGSLLLNIGQAVGRHMGDPDRIKYYAQELKANTFNLTRMNLVMRGIKPDNIVARNGDSLAHDWPIFDDRDPVQTYRPLYVDAVVSNPPYSQHWEPKDQEADPRYARFALAPPGKADYAFLLHDLFHVKPDGIVTIVLPHGVLFRGHSEAVIRERLVEGNHIDVVIGLPANIFFGTPIPTIIMVLKQKRDRDDVLFIDASAGFEKVGKNNQLRASDVLRIADAVEQRTDVERFARVVSRDEIRENEYNLNIPRYVTAGVPNEPIDLYGTIFGGIPWDEIESLSAYWDELPGLRETLLTVDAQGYAHLASGDPHATIDDHSSVADFRARVKESLAGLPEYLRAQLVVGRAGVPVRQTEDVLTRNIFERLSGLPLVDPYDAYQALHDRWGQIRTDLEVIQTEGDEAIRVVDPQMRLKTNQKTKVATEVQDGWKGRVIPFELVQRELLQQQAIAVQQLEGRLAEIDVEVSELLQGLTEEDKLSLSDVLKEDGESFYKGALDKSVKELTRSGDTWPAEGPEAAQIGAQALLDERAQVAKQAKTGREALDVATRAAIERLTDSQIDALLAVKWVEPLMTDLLSMPSRIIRDLHRRVEALEAKYAVGLTELDKRVVETQRELHGMLGALTGSHRDVQALKVLRSVLGGPHA
jgi:type I restriction enzyme M protein